jgi:hypothetical protein
MRRIPLLFTSILIFTATKVQCQNLVPNPSFENYSTCPDEFNGISQAIGWSAFRLNAEYFNACVESGFTDVPNSNWAGYQNAFHGDGYAGIIGAKFDGDFDQERDFIGAQLTQPLEVGTNYFISFRINRALGGFYPKNSNAAVNNFGVLFTMEEYVGGLNNMPMSNEFHVGSAEIISDTLEWTLISGWFEADQPYEYVVLGNFFDSQYLEIELLDSVLVWDTYYLIDAICVSTDSTNCFDIDPLSVSSKLSSDYINLYPNPTTEKIHCEFDNPLSGLIKVRNSLGMLIDQFELKNKQKFSLDCEAYRPGTYIIQINLNNRVTTKRFVKL